MVLVLAYLAALLGYGAWQVDRYRRAVPQREVRGRAIADVCAFAVVLLFVWSGGALLPLWGLAADGGPGAAIGAIVGFVLSGPTRRTVLRRLGVDPLGLM